MKVSPTPTRHPAAASAASLCIRSAETPADWRIAHNLLDDEHLLGAGREAGDRLCQFILEEDEIVAVLIWCAAAWHLQDRDTMIGWDPVTRSQRLKLVVQLRRFLVPGKTRRPNLASQCLGLALRELPARWHAEHGYRPLMAESFSDPESHHGTVYPAGAGSPTGPARATPKASPRTTPTTTCPMAVQKNSGSSPSPRTPAPCCAPRKSPRIARPGSPKAAAPAAR